MAVVGDAGCEMRVAGCEMWDLECAGCPRNNRVLRIQHSLVGQRHFLRQIRRKVCHCLELVRLALLQIRPPQLQAVLGLLVALTACGCERASSCGALVHNREQWHTFTGASTMKVALSN